METGEATFRAVREAFTLQTQLGMAVFRSGRRVRIRSADGVLRYAVELGSARFSSIGGGDVVEAKEGEVYEVGIGEAVLRRVSEEPEPDTPDAGEPDAAHPRSARRPNSSLPRLGLTARPRHSHRR